MREGDDSSPDIPIRSVRCLWGSSFGGEHSLHCGVFVRDGVVLSGDTVTPSTTAFFLKGGEQHFVELGPVNQSIYANAMWGCSLTSLMMWTGSEGSSLYGE